MKLNQQEEKLSQAAAKAGMSENTSLEVSSCGEITEPM